jgi:hypothetical protein
LGTLPMWVVWRAHREVEDSILVGIELESHEQFECSDKTAAELFPCRFAEIEFLPDTSHRCSGSARLALSHHQDM